MADQFETMQKTRRDPIFDWEAITPNDSNNLTRRPRSIGSMSGADESSAAGPAKLRSAGRRPLRRSASITLCAAIEKRKLSSGVVSS